MKSIKFVLDDNEKQKDVISKETYWWIQKCAENLLTYPATPDQGKHAALQLDLGFVIGDNHNYFRIW